MRNQHYSILLILTILLILSGCRNDENKYLTDVISEFPIEETLEPALSVTPKSSENITNSVNMAGQYIVCGDYNAAFLRAV